MLQFSLLDLSPIPEGKTAADALTATVDLAEPAEGWGYHRFLLADITTCPALPVRRPLW